MLIEICIQPQHIVTPFLGNRYMCLPHRTTVFLPLRRVRDLYLVSHLHLYQWWFLSPRITLVLDLCAERSYSPEKMFLLSSANWAINGKFSVVIGPKQIALCLSFFFSHFCEQVLCLLLVDQSGFLCFFYIAF